MSESHSFIGKTVEERKAHGLPLHRQALRTLGYGLYTLTSQMGDRRSGMTLNWATQCSSRPQLLVVAVEQASGTLEVVRAAGRFVLATIAEDQRGVAIALGRPSRHFPRKLDDVTLVLTPSGLPYPSSAASWIECEVRSEHVAGDHLLVIGEVVDAAVGTRSPLTLRGAGLRYGS